MEEDERDEQIERELAQTPIQEARDVNVKMRKRIEALLPNGIPRYIRCYDNGGPDEGGSTDRYTVVYTGRRGDGCFLNMSGNPSHPQGVCQHTTTEDGRPVDVDSHGWPPAVGRKHGALGRRIKFEDLPLDCQFAANREYISSWELDQELALDWIKRQRGRVPTQVPEPERARGDLAMPDSLADKLAPPDKPRDADAGLPEGLDDLRFGPGGHLLYGVGVLRAVKDAELGQELREFLEDPLRSTPYKMARYGESAKDYMSEAELAQLERLTPSGRVEAKKQEIEDRRQEHERRRQIQGQVLDLFRSKPELWAGLLPERDLPAPPAVSSEAFWSNKGYLLMLADWGDASSTGKPRIWYALIGPYTADEVLPSDGIADGGEPYTDDEMALIGSSLDVIFIGNDFYCAPGIEDPTGPRAAKHLLDLLTHRPEDEEDWAKLDDRQKAFHSSGEGDELDVDFGVESYD